MREPAAFEASWKLRRRVVFGTLGFCAVIVLFLTFRGQDTRLHETIASGLIFLAGSVVMAYVFGSAYDDRNRRQAVVSYRATMMTRTGRVDDPDAG